MSLPDMTVDPNADAIVRRILAPIGYLPGQYMGFLMSRRAEGATLSAIEYLARCHCGALSARYRTAAEPSTWSLRACQCSFCRSHGALTTSDPAGSLEFRSADPERVQRYRFGGRTADFLVCRDCGVYVGAHAATDGMRFGLLNVLSLRPPLTGLPAAELMDYGPETADIRRLRREARWTPVLAESV